MKVRCSGWPVSLTLLTILCWATKLLASDSQAKVTVQWEKVIRVSKTNASLLVMNSNPLLRRGSPIHDQAFQALRDLNADYVAHLAWFPYPKVAVAELEPPQDGKTSWDFSLIDTMTVDFLEATKRHPVIVNFSTIPQWMFKTPNPIRYPADPDQVDWSYQQGTELRDPSLKELGDYYARLASWYTKGGFQDEYGRWHESGHHFQIHTWGVLNEVDLEHLTSPQQYTTRYDAIVEAVRRVAPEMKFAGPFLALPTKSPEFFEYFLNSKNHKPGIPLDLLTYHFYAIPTLDQSFEDQQLTIFEQADKFLDVVRYIDSIRQRLAPHTLTAINELGIILPTDFLQGFLQGTAEQAFKPIPDAYRNLYGAMYAYCFAELAGMGIDIVQESQLVGKPGQFASVTMIDWKSGRPNGTYWVLKIIRDNFAPGDKLVRARVETPPEPPILPPYIYAAAFVKSDGTRKLLLVNRRNRTFKVSILGGTGSRIEVVDQTTGYHSPVSSKLSGDELTLQGLAVAVVTLPKSSGMPSSLRERASGRES